MSYNQHHVVPNKEGGWNVKKAGAKRATAHTKTKQEAVDIARKISENQHSELLIHDKKGKIQRRDSHGNDPFPPRDKN
ncbi:hypothetical protein B6U55_03060 [Ligilactobacillus salivarius]|uniref:DUF2188 domain-containing protein n=1 Tax=Ligilactobacillus salivarius TaxID=1624 RepID=UPI0009DAF1E4|nr:DUF2188 domain-containing protein [Ligilactobacillus salivarius]OQQ93728.1 hypothetical protein B6U55_03060 [Ligilactobacillus salivarius]